MAAISKATLAQRRPLRYVAVAVGLALVACRLWRCSSTFAFSMAGPAVLDRPDAERDGGRRAKGADHPEERAEGGAERMAEPEATSNSTMELEGGKPDDSALGVAQGPPWANCFVEYVEAGRPVLEEWLLQGEPESIAAFRAWRGHGTGAPRGPAPASIRCAPTSLRPGEEVLCLECLSHSGAFASAPAGRGAASLATVRAELVGTFAELRQCLAATEGGAGFCKSGQVVVPV
mmetsp:Transcript_102043/g.284047  ORF Transcript_102043/g.284047 Transcript_102043/m.284047 type:complete len:233 (+) Transcript_102043:120-818(+)